MIALAVIGVYLLLVLGVGGLASFASRGTRADYVLASRTIGPVLLLMSLFGTTMTAFALVGSTGKSFVAGVGIYGMLAAGSGIVHSLCFFVIGVKMWSVGRKFGFTTQAQFFRERLQSDGVGVLLFFVLVLLVIPYLLIGVISSGLFIQTMTAATEQYAGAFPSLFPDTGGAVPKWLGSLGICLVVLTYVFFGGMRGTAWANTFQTAVFMVLGVVAFYVIASNIGGKSTWLENLQAATGAVAKEHPEKLSRELIPHLKHFSYLLVPLSVAMFPHVFQHWLTARSAAAFKLPIVLHPVFILIVWVPCVMMGVWATAVPELAELTPKEDGKVLPLLVRTQAGPYLGGLLAAGVLAAIMSSLDSQFLCLGTMFSNDIVMHYAGENRFTDSQQVFLARGFVVAIVAVTYGLSLFAPLRVFDLGVWCFSGFAALFPLVLAALYWKRLTALGAYASILTTGATWAWLFYRADFGGKGDYPLQVEFARLVIDFPPILLIVTASAAALVITSLMTKPPSRSVLVKFFG